MTLNAALYAKLTGTTAIAALIDARAYPLLAPTSAAFPRVTFQRISGAPAHHLRGVSALETVHMQIDAYDDDAAGATALAVQIKTALDMQYGVVWGTVQIDSCSLENEHDLIEPPADASDAGIYHVTLDFEITYRP